MHKYKLLVLGGLLLVVGFASTALSLSMESVRLQKQNLSASISLFDWFRKGDTTSVITPATPEEEIQEISARKCKRLGGTWFYGTMDLDDPITGNTILTVGTPGEWSCIVPGNSVSNIPLVPTFETSIDQPTEGEDIQAISMKRCIKKGGTVILVPASDKWLCVFPIDSVHTIYNETLGIKEPINKDTIKWYTMLERASQSASSY